MFLHVRLGPVGRLTRLERLRQYGLSVPGLLQLPTKSSGTAHWVSTAAIELLQCFGMPESGAEMDLGSTCRP